MSPNPVANTKRFVLKTLFKLGGQPMQKELLEDAIYRMVAPKPLPSEVKLALEELEREDGMISGRPDKFDREQISYTLTTAGDHEGAKL